MKEQAGIIYFRTDHATTQLTIEVDPWVPQEAIARIMSALAPLTGCVCCLPAYRPADGPYGMCADVEAGGEVTWYERT